ncbi:hypothetical protein EMN47_03815 [Prolixibacteraceae bacterium JC049]|nr:hypothetical protein [Prolixibacteraceae bacterium JC049]
MIIKSIAIENFQCYSGPKENNTFEFRDGLNVIIGDNGSGKSKLYDAFFWVLYDKIFNSSTRDLEPTSHVGINLLSDSAKFNCELNQSVTATIQLILEDKKSNSQYPDGYLLQRSFKIKRVKELEDFNDPNAWEVASKSITTAEKKDILNFKPLHGDDSFSKIVDKLLPTAMKPYLWFQGEQVDSLIDFKKEDSLTEAINILSDISHYDFLIEVSEKVFNQASGAYKTELIRNSKLSKNANDLQKRQEELENNIKKAEKDLEQIQEQLLYAKENKDELLGKIEDAKELEKLKVEIETSKNKVNRVKNRLENARKNFNSNLFSKKWLLRNAAPYLDQFESLLKEYYEKRENQKIDYKIELQQEEARKNRLPENVPNKVYLGEMLKEKQCFLCDRSFEEGDHAHQYITSILEKAKSNRVRYSDFLQNDLKKNFDALYTTASYLRNHDIGTVDQSIQNELERINEIEDQQQIAIEEYKTIQDKLNHLLATTKVDKDESNKIINLFNQLDSSKDHFKEQEIHTKNRLEENKAELKKVLADLKESLGADINQGIALRKEITEAFAELSKSTRNMVYGEQIKRIEEEANKHFQKMTEENSSVRGRIILEKRGKSYMPKNVDENGVELTSINDSNIILIKLATIMAIVSAKGVTGLHPMISDAPTSKFSDNYTMGFCKTINKVFKQSIIISYDFYQNLELRNRLLNEVNGLGSVYVIEPSTSEESRMSRIDLSTKITTLN